MLNASLADQIAAGEVVERPASVIKELVENSIDAGATRVDVEVEDGGLTSIRVLDDGGGIHPEDLVLALTRHGTSKIRGPEDLVDIVTLGFRGEALASVAAVARVTLRSRRSGAEVGAEIHSVPGDTPRPMPVGMPVGTQVEVRGLFGNVPARRKFMRSEATEVGHCTETLMRVALIHPEVHVTLRHGKRELLNLPATTLEGRVLQILERRTPGPFFALAGVEDGISIQAWLAEPSAAAAGRGGLFIVTRRRVVKERSLAQILGQAMGEALAGGSSPVGCLIVEPPPATVDVNVHPQKSEVRFSDPQRIYAALRRVLARELPRAPWAATGAAAVEPGAAAVSGALGAARRWAEGTPTSEEMPLGPGAGGEASRAGGGERGGGERPSGVASREVAREVVRGAGDGASGRSPAAADVLTRGTGSAKVRPPGAAATFGGADEADDEEEDDDEDGEERGEDGEERGEEADEEGARPRGGAGGARGLAEAGRASLYRGTGGRAEGGRAAQGAAAGASAGLRGEARPGAYRLGTRALATDYAEHKREVREAAADLHQARSDAAAVASPPSRRPSGIGPLFAGVRAPIGFDALTSGDEDEDDEAVASMRGEAGPGLRRPPPRLLTCLPGPVALFAEEDEVLAVDLRRLRAHLVLQRLMRDLKASRHVAVQGLLTPVVVRRAADEVALCHEAQAELLTLGIDLDAFGDDAVVVRGVPAQLRHCLDDADIGDLIARVIPWLRLRALGGERAEPQHLLAAIASTAGSDPAPRLARRWIAEIHAAGESLAAIPGVRRWTAPELLGERS